MSLLLPTSLNVPAMEEGLSLRWLLAYQKIVKVCLPRMGGEDPAPQHAWQKA